jgi:hypothetical protein
MGDIIFRSVIFSDGTGIRGILCEFQPATHAVPYSENFSAHGVIAYTEVLTDIRALAGGTGGMVYGHLIRGL